MTFDLDKFVNIYINQTAGYRDIVIKLFSCYEDVVK